MNRLVTAALVVAVAAAATAAALLASRDRPAATPLVPRVEFLDAPVGEWSPPGGK